MPRLTLVSAGKIMATAAIAFLSFNAVAADVPANQTDQTPGFFRASVGDYTVTALYDGYVNLDPGLVKGMSEENIQALLARMFLHTDDGMQTGRERIPCPYR